MQCACPNRHAQQQRGKAKSKLDKDNRPQGIGQPVLPCLIELAYQANDGDDSKNRYPAMMKLGRSRIFKRIPYSLFPIFIRDKPIAHQRIFIIKQASIHPRHKSPCQNGQPDQPKGGQIMPARQAGTPKSQIGRCPDKAGKDDKGNAEMTGQAILRDSRIIYQTGSNHPPANNPLKTAQK